MRYRDWTSQVCLSTKTSVSSGYRNSSWDPESSWSILLHSQLKTSSAVSRTSMHRSFVVWWQLSLVLRWNTFGSGKLFPINWNTFWTSTVDISQTDALEFANLRLGLLRCTNIDPVLLAKTVIALGEAFKAGVPISETSRRLNLVLADYIQQETSEFFRIIRPNCWQKVLETFTL